MKHITMADKSLLVDDEAAELLVTYAARLATRSEGDAVTLNAIGADGDPVEATFLLNEGTVMLVESSYADFPPPDNSAAIDYLRSRIEVIDSPPTVQPTSPEDARDWGDVESL